MFPQGRLTSTTQHQKQRNIQPCKRCSSSRLNYCINITNIRYKMAVFQQRKNCRTWYNSPHCSACMLPLLQLQLSQPRRWREGAHENNSPPTDIRLEVILPELDPAT